MGYGQLNYKSLLTIGALATAGLLLNTACGSFGSSGSSSSATTTAVSQIVLSATATSLTNGESITLTASGGSGSYTSLTVSPTSGCGTLSALSGATATYIAPTVSTTTTCTLTLEDSLSEVTTLALTIGATSTSTTTSSGGDGITITPTAESVALGGTVSFTVSGGVAPYSWSVSYSPSVSGGNLNASNGPSALFTAPNSATTATITVTDSLNYAAYAEITVGTSTAAGTAASCSGNFNWVTGSTTQTLTLLEDTSTNKIAGYFGSSNTAVSGTCTSTGLSFTVVGNSSLTFSGTFYTNSSSQEIVLGTYNGQSSYLSPQ